LFFMLNNWREGMSQKRHRRQPQRSDERKPPVRWRFTDWAAI